VPQPRLVIRDTFEAATARGACLLRSRPLGPPTPAIYDGTMPKRVPKKKQLSKSKPPFQRHRRRAKPAKLVPHEPGTDRLQKVLASAGVASRRECEQLILDGRVEIDRQVVTELGSRVNPQTQEIRVDGEVIHEGRPIYYAVNKPDGVVCTARDPSGRPRVIDMLPPGAPRAYCVGRLDMASEGLILVTNDGELANGLTHPSHGVEKIYHVQVFGSVNDEGLKQLRKGMHLAEGFAQAKHVRIKSHKKNSTILEMVLDEGRNREIRRLLARIGHKVQRLTRIAVGPVRLGDMPPGAVRLLTKQEISALREAIKAGPRKKKSLQTSTQSPNKKKVNHGGHGEHGDKKRSIIGG
jgi:23S rRNA pseudouridine2605 synthase